MSEPADTDEFEISRTNSRNWGFLKQNPEKRQVDALYFWMSHINQDRDVTDIDDGAN